MSIKTFIKDTWVLGLALIIGGVIVYKNTAEDKPKEEPKVVIPTVKVVEEPQTKEAVIVEGSQTAEENVGAVVDKNNQVVIIPTKTPQVVKGNQPVNPDPVLTVPLTKEFEIKVVNVKRNEIPDYLIPTSVNFDIPEGESLTR